MRHDRFDSYYWLLWSLVAVTRSMSKVNAVLMKEKKYGGDVSDFSIFAHLQSLWRTVWYFVDSICGPSILSTVWYTSKNTNYCHSLLCSLRCILCRDSSKDESINRADHAVNLEKQNNVKTTPKILILLSSTSLRILIVEVKVFAWSCMSVYIG